MLLLLTAGLIALGGASLVQALVFAGTFQLIAQVLLLGIKLGEKGDLKATWTRR